MGSLSLAVECLLAMLAAFCVGWSSMEDTGFQVRLQGSSSPCQGRLQVYKQGSWSTVCAQSWGLRRGSLQDLAQVSQLCQQLRCGEVCRFGVISTFSAPQSWLPQITCFGAPVSFFNCSSNAAGWCQPLSLICLEPQKTTPPPTSPPPPTTPAPTAPPRLWLAAGPRGLQCAGTVEFYSGHLGGVIGYPAPDDKDDMLWGLGTLICRSLGCGSFLRRLPGPEVPRPIGWMVQNASCTALPQCFRQVHRGEAGLALALVCSGFQPKVQSRLVGGGSTCQGTVEVRQGGPEAQWVALCHSTRSSARWEALCQEQQCGRFLTYHELDAVVGTRGLLCPEKLLSECHVLEERRSCRRAYITCQDPHPPGLAAGTVGSIVLALLLLVVLLVLCGPLAYRKLMKRVRQKKQRQWIGPTGMNKREGEQEMKFLGAGRGQQVTELSPARVQCLSTATTLPPCGPKLRTAQHHTWTMSTASRPGAPTCLLTQLWKGPYASLLPSLTTPQTATTTCTPHRGSEQVLMGVRCRTTRASVWKPP